MSKYTRMLAPTHNRHWVDQNRALCGAKITKEWRASNCRHNMCLLCREIKRAMDKVSRRAYAQQRRRKRK